MSVRYIDPDLTKDVTLDGVTFTLGFWPPVKAERIGLHLSKLRASGVKELKDAEPEKAYEAIGINRELAEDSVRYSVRSWKWDGAPDAVLENGVLSDRCITALHLSGLLYPLSNECMAFNTLSEDEKKRPD